jgi:glycogen debranching enzyme
VSDGKVTDKAKPEHGDAHRNRDERKQRIQTHGRASVTRSIADAVVAKDGDIFFLTRPDGSVPMESNHGFGLYYNDCRYLDGYEMRLADTRPEALVSAADRGFMAVIELTNPDINTTEGKTILKESLGVTWERTIDSAGLRLCDAITIHNFGLEPIELPVSLTFRAGFEDVFAVRGMLNECLGKLHPPNWKDEVLRFDYDGADDIHRRLCVQFSPAPQSTDKTTAHFQVNLSTEESAKLNVFIRITESKDRAKVETAAQKQPDTGIIKHVEQRSSDESLSKETDIRSDSVLLNKILERSLRDLHMLKSKIDGRQFFAAGVPWFVTLFGRDSIISSLQTLAYDPDIAEQTLRILADYQGKKVDKWRDEEPGKIMHELRIGEMAHLNEIPQTPYYGTVDATPLFLILIARHAHWTGQMTLFNDLRENIEAALEWMSEYADQNRDGYIEYQSRSKGGLINQGWKDSGNSMVNVDGSLANPPISLVEVQAYVYMAKTGIADLYERAGEQERANRLRQEASELRQRFNHDFWMEDKGCYSMAMEAEGRQVKVISSNPGHALWAGIADEDKARRTAERLMADDMFNGWGIRTLSHEERRYNPIGYHLGTVWPHDNSIIAAGFRRYGFDEEALRIFTGIAEAAMNFEHYRLPEVFAGYGRHLYGVPVRYPVACHPQAWAAGTMPHLTETLLGLRPQAFERKLRIVRPVLPDFVDRIKVRRLKVGSAVVDLSFERSSEKTVAVEVLNIEGQLEVSVEPSA